MANYTIHDFFEDYFTGEPEAIAKEHLWEMMNDLDRLDAFRGGIWGPDDIMENIESDMKKRR